MSKVDLNMPNLVGINPLIPESWISYLVIDGQAHSLGDIGIVEEARAEDVQVKAMALFKEVVCQ